MSIITQEFNYDGWFEKGEKNRVLKLKKYPKVGTFSVTYQGVKIPVSLNQESKYVTILKRPLRRRLTDAIFEGKIKSLENENFVVTYEKESFWKVIFHERKNFLPNEAARYEHVIRREFFSLLHIIYSSSQNDLSDIVFDSASKGKVIYITTEQYVLKFCYKPDDIITLTWYQNEKTFPSAMLSKFRKKVRLEPTGKKVKGEGNLLEIATITTSNFEDLLHIIEESYRMAM